MPIQGNIQLRPQTEGTLPAFGFDSQSSSGGNVVTDSDVQPAPRRIGKASPSVSSFLVTPFAKTPAGTVDVNHVMSGLNMMTTPATVASNAFYILVVCLVPPGSPRLRQGESWCAQCTSLRCAVRGLHELHVCMDCEHTMKVSTRGGDGDPWAAPE